MKEKFLAGHYGYGHAKTELLNTILEYFGQAREKREALEQNPKYVEDILQEGAKKARAIASKKYRKQKKLSVYWEIFINKKLPLIKGYSNVG